jgi:flagellar hook-associated protein 2
VERLSGAGTGATSVRVVALASSAQRTYAITPQAAPRTFSIAPAGGGPAVDVNVGADATLDDIVSAINGRPDAAVFAAAVRTNPSDPASARLVLSSRTTGVAGGFTLSEGGTAVADVAGTAKAGRDAAYFLDGETDPALVRTSPTNVVDNAVPGLRLTLKGTTAADVALTVGPPAPDPEAVKGKLKAFVEAYNAVVTLARAKTSERAVPDATTTADAVKGQLFGDAGLVGLVAALRAGASGAVGVVLNPDGTVASRENPAAMDELADLGITTGAIGAGRAAASGTLQIDDAKLTAKLAADPQAARRLLGGVAGVPGFAQRVEGLVQQQIGTTDALDSTGTLDARLKGSTDEQKRLSDVMTRTESRLAAKEKRLRAQFAAMEAALQASQTQGAWLSGQLAALQPSR